MLTKMLNEDHWTCMLDEIIPLWNTGLFRPSFQTKLQAKNPQTLALEPQQAVSGFCQVQKEADSIAYQFCFTFLYIYISIRSFKSYCFQMLVSLSTGRGCIITQNLKQIFVNVNCFCPVDFSNLELHSFD